MSALCQKAFANLQQIFEHGHSLLSLSEDILNDFQFSRTSLSFNRLLPPFSPPASQMSTFPGKEARLRTQIPCFVSKSSW